MEYGLIASRISHSFSKEVHSHIADYDYELKQLKAEELDGFFKNKAFKAINVTIPYKEAVIPYLYEIDEFAQKIGAVNTVVNKNGRLYGYNTDFLGMKALIQKNNIEICGKKVLILGSGGTAKTARAVCENLGACEVLTVSRTGAQCNITYEDAYKYHSDTQIIINTTPCGMYPEINTTAIDLSCFNRLEGAVDAVYNPLQTQFAINAKNSGAAAVCGLYMLVAQAVYACEYFLDKKLPADTVEKVYNKILYKKRNIVLIGMPSCGKTTIGKLIAQKENRPFIDTDLLIEEKTGRHPSVIIKEQGEETFRNIESEIIADVSAVGGRVISTGGGAVLRRENRENLIKNGVVFFIDRPLKMLSATADRPLSSDKSKLEAMYYSRLPIYTQFADFIIDNSGEAAAAAEQILKEMKNENFGN